MNQVFYTDSELLEGLANGNTEAIDTFYRLYHPILLKWMLSRGGLEVDAEDVFQEALLVVYEKAKSEAFCLTCKLSTYLFSISKRLWFKKLQQNSQLVFKDELSDSEAEKNTTDDDLKLSWEKEQKYLQLEQALNKIGEPCKSLLKAFYEDQKNMQDLALQFNYTNAENAKTQKYKCLTRLRKMFFKLQKETEN